LQQIEDSYPNARKPLSEVFPALFSWLKLFKRINPAADSKETLVNVMSEDEVKMEVEIKKTDSRMNEIIKESHAEPYAGTSYIVSEMENLGTKEKDLPQGTDIFKEYGFGITSWLSLLRSLIALYAVLSVAAVGVMMAYSSGQELVGSEFKTTA